MGSLTRGPLPAAVYWRRRLVVLTLAVLLVIVIVKVLGSGGGGSGGEARLSGAQISDSVAAPPSRATHKSASKSPHARASASASPSVTPSASATTLPAPTGTCQADDVVVTPSVATATVGHDVTVILTLRTDAAAACTWHASASTMQVRFATADAAVWSSVDCGSALPDADVVVRRDTPTTLSFTWDAHSSDGGCSSHTSWAQSGEYSVTASALGGEPRTSTFTLGTTVTVTADPTPTATPSRSSSGR